MGRAVPLRRRPTMMAMGTLFALSLTFGFAHQSTGAKQQVAGTDLTVSGQVKDQAGRPVPGAYVGTAGTWVRADSSGRYQLVTDATKQLSLQAWAPGFVSIPVNMLDPAGGVMEGSMRLDFSGRYALWNAFDNRLLGARLFGLPVTTPLSTTSVHLFGRSSVPLEPFLQVTLPDGSVQQYPLHAQSRFFSATLPFMERGAYQVEINATSGFAAFNVRVFHGVRVSPPTVPVVASEPVKDGDVQGAQYALALVNRLRQARKEPPLTMQPQLFQAARGHNLDILRYGYFLVHPHIGSDGSTPLERIVQTGLLIRAGGEDVGMAPSVTAAIFGFMDSPSHRATILGNYRYAGIAVSHATGQILMTIDVAR